jgi:hypothetical protein
MPRWTRIFQSNFTKGMLNQSAWDRLDTKIYSSGARNMLNAALVSQGGFKRRAGTRLLDSIGGSQVRLGGMFYSTTEMYLLVFTPGQVIIYDAIGLAPVQTLTGLPWGVAQPFGTPSLADIYFITVEGVILVCHPWFWPVQINRLYQNNFNWQWYSFEKSSDNARSFQPYYKFAAQPTLITPSATAVGNMTLTTNGAYWSTHHSYLNPDGTKPRVRITYPADPVTSTTTQIFEFTINSVTDNQNIQVTLLGSKPLPNTNAMVTWDEQLCSQVWGYPVCCGFQDQRFVFGGHPAAPGFLTLSQIGAPHNFDTGTAQDDEAIAIVLTTESTNQIKGMISGLHFIIMTTQGPFFFPNSNTNPLTPSNCGFRRTAGQQCAAVKPVIYDSAAIYSQRKGNHIREMVFDLYRQAYTTSAISLLSNDLISTPSELHVIPSDPNNSDLYLFVLNSSGTYAGSAAVYIGDRDQEIGGWTNWDTANGNILSAAEIGEFFFMAVTRVINNTSVIALELLDWTRIFDAGQVQTSATAKTVWTGLTRYLNTQVQVMGDGYAMGSYTVDGSGNLTLPASYACKTLEVGFDFTFLVETLPVDGALNDGPVQGRPYDIASTVVKLINTDNVTVNGDRLWARLPYDQVQLTQPLFSGPFECWIEDWNRTQTIKIAQGNPGPIQVTAISCELDVS